MSLKAPFPWFGSLENVMYIMDFGILTRTAKVLEAPPPPLTARDLSGGSRAMAHPTSLPLLTPEELERFWSKVDKSGDCWLWQAAKTEKGYGVFSLRGRTYKAHRVAYELLVGPIPAGLCLCHNCPGGDEPACCDPSHMFLGTKRENNADMVAKGRHVPGGTYGGAYPLGEAHHNAVLTETDVREMRSRSLGGDSFSIIARDFGVGLTTAYKAIKGITWKGVA